MNIHLSPQSPFAASHETLSKNGFHVIPIGPHTKAPSEYRSGKWWPMREWQKFRADPAPAHITRLWSQWNDANIGVLTGTGAGPGHVLAVVDFDSDDYDVLQELQSAIPVSPVQKKGKRGYSGFYRVAVGTVGFRTDLVELLTDTRQTVIPPSIHPDTGSAYQWTGTKTLLDMPVTDLPLLSEDDLEQFRDTLAGLLKKPVLAPRQVVKVADDADASIWRRINTKAYNELDLWVPELGLPKLQRTATGYKAVAHWRASSTGKPMASRGQNFSIMVGLGSRDFGNGDSYTALNLVAAALSMTDDEAFQWLGSRLGLVEINSFGSSNIGSSNQVTLPLNHTEAHDPETGKIVDIPKAQEIAREFELPHRLTHPPGLLGEVVDWIFRASLQSNRTLALGAALTLLATCIAKGVSGPKGENSPHLYVIGMAPSGGGKDGPLKAIPKLLRAANLGDRVGPSEFMSMSAVINYLTKRSVQPTFVCAIDEFGAYLKRILSKKAASHEQGITKPLRSLWSCNHDDYETPQWASVNSQTVESPAMSIYGTSTPEDFFAALEGDDVANGFLNRFLLLTTSIMGAERDYVETTPPQDLRLKITELRRWAETLPQGVTDPRATRKLMWGGGKLVYDDFREAMKIKRDGQLKNYYARTAEMGIRLAMIITAGIGGEKIEADAMAWGAEIALWSSDRMAEMAEMYMAEGEHKKNQNRVMRYLDKNGTASKRDIYRYALHSELKKREFDDLLSILKDVGQIIEDFGPTPPSGGPRPRIYRKAA
jgi:Bifunctional DNA primase/polymerase, N-terminal